MKRIVLALLPLFLSVTCFAGQGFPPGPASAAKPSPSPLSPEDLRLQKVHEVPGMTKMEIYNRSLEWMAKTFTDSKAVIEIKDQEAGKIIGKGTTLVRSGVGPFMGFWSCRFTMTIEIQEGRFRATYDNFTSDTGYHPDRKDALDRIKTENLVPLDESLDVFVRQPRSDTW